MQIKVTVDSEKCKEAFRCHKCVAACARSALSMVPTVPSFRGTEIDPKNYMIVAKHMADCTTCMDCVRLCPEGAITVSVN